VCLGFAGNLVFSVAFLPLFLVPTMYIPTGLVGIMVNIGTGRVDGVWMGVVVLPKGFVVEGVVVTKVHATLGAVFALEGAVADPVW